MEKTETKIAVVDSGLKVNLPKAVKDVAIATVITMEQFVNVLFNVIGVTFMGCNTLTVPDMNKGGRANSNYMFGKVLKKSVVHVMMGFDYENRVDSIASKKWLDDAIACAVAAGVDMDIINQSISDLKEHSKQSIEAYEAKERKWGKHMLNPYTGKTSRIMIHHTKKDKVTKELLPETYKRYMQVEILSAKSPEYVYADTLEPLSADDLLCVKDYLKPRKDEGIVIRDYAIENIKAVRVNKTHYKIVG